MRLPRRRSAVGALLATVFVAFAAPASILAGAVPPRSDVPDGTVVIEIFWGDGCPHCEGAIDDLTPFAAARPQVELRLYEVWFDAANRDLMQRRATELGVRADAVPFIVVGSRAWIGYSASTAQQVKSTVLALVQDVVPPERDDSTLVDVPFIGGVDLQDRSLLLSTVLIAFVDGFNPCSLWVLTVLLGLVLHTGSRRRVLVVGGTFLLVTTVIYGAFIVGVYSTLSYVGVTGWMRAAVAVVALTFGIVNVKDFLWFKKGISFTIPESQKPSIYRRSRRLMRPGSTLPAVVAGTVVLAAGVALIELPCTAGFPVIWSNLMNRADVAWVEFAVLLLVYLVVYLLDELLVFGAVVVTMRATKLQERHGRALKLVGGMVMIAIAVTMVVAPDLMETVGGVLGVFALALLGSAVVAILHRTLRGPAAEAR